MHTAPSSLAISILFQLPLARCMHPYCNIPTHPRGFYTIFENNNKKGQMRRPHFSNLIATKLLASGLPAHAFARKAGNALNRSIFRKTCTNRSSHHQLTSGCHVTICRKWPKMLMHKNEGECFKISHGRDCRCCSVDGISAGPVRRRPG